MAKAANTEPMVEDTKELEFIKSMNVYEKICAVSSEVGRVQMSLNVATKTDKNGNPIKSYKAISINDVVDALIPLLAKYRLAVIPTEKEIIAQELIEKETQYGPQKNFYIRLRASYKVVNIDKPREFVESYAYGDGIDTGDKATGKALTYARKYVLIDIFNLSKGEDPDEEASPNEGYNKSKKQQAPPRQNAPQTAPPDMAVEFTRLRGELAKVGYDLHNEKVISFIKERANVNTVDPGILLGDVDAMSRVLVTMTGILKSKQS